MVEITVYEGDSLEEAANASIAYINKKYPSSNSGKGFSLTSASPQQDSSGQVITSSKEDKE